jgi:hypothetical protein
MLFTDGIILTLQDLRDHDNFVLEVASTESIELSSKMAIAQRAVGYELASFLGTRETPISLSRVVVNDELRDLLAVRTLAAVYSDAYNRHLNDRYLGRAKELREAGEHSFYRFLQNGVGIAGAAVPRSEKPMVTTLPDGELLAGLYTVQIAWAHAGGSVGERSEEVTVECPGGSLMVIPPASPSQITGWHVFIAGIGSKPMRQNATPVAVNQEWMQSVMLRSDLVGPQPSGPDYYMRHSTHLVRR